MECSCILYEVKGEERFRERPSSYTSLWIQLRKLRSGCSLQLFLPKCQLPSKIVTLELLPREYITIIFVWGSGACAAAYDKRLMFYYWFTWLK